MRISKTGGSPSYDSLNGMTGFARAGTLTVTNITSNGNHLAAGDTFYLFSGSGYSGTFATINLPVLDAGLSWDLSGLYTGGSIFVSANAATPIFTPTPGNYAGALPVTITSESGATIHYTTDGSDPTTSGTVLSAASPATVTIPAETASLTITAYATKSGEGNSGNASATYSTIGTMTWITPADGSWSGTYNWSNNLVASGPGVTADFSTLTLTANTTVTLDTPTTVGNLVFGDQGDAFNWILANGGVGPLTLNNGTNASVITVVNTNTTIAATLAGTNGLAKAGAGTLTLSGTNTYTGATIISNATLIVSSPANLNSALPSAVNITNPGILAVAAGGTGQTFANAVSGAGTVNYSGTGENRLAGDWSGFTGILDINTSGGGKLDDQTTTTPFGSAATVNIATGASFYLGNSNTYANTFAIIGTGNTENRGALRLDSGVITGNVQLLGNATIGNSSGSGSGGSTISGVISGGYVLQTAGTWGSVANLTLAGANTYSGGTAISAGWLKVGNPAALGTGPVALTGGKLDLNATNLNLQNLSGTGGLITDLQTNEPAAVTSTLTVNQVADNTFAGTIQNGTSNSVGLVKIGSAALILSGINTYTGLTTVSNGTLEVNGAIGASAVTVKAPATLAGTGTIGGAVTVNGTLSAGTNGLGALTINNNLTLNAGSTATLAIDRTAGTATYGKVQGITTATFGGTLTVTSLGGTFVNGDTFPLFSATSHIGNFTATNLPALGAGLGWQWTPASGVLSVVASGPSGPAAITNHISGSTLTLTWPAGQGWRLVGQTNSLSTGLSTNWGTVPGVSDGSATITVDPAKPTVFYRLVYP
jgi:autotransporter-associated beta strand protein